MLIYIKTTSDNADFQQLVTQLDADLAIRDGDQHDFYHQFNKTAGLKYVIVAYDGQHPVGCGAIREYTPGVMEVKRMYVPPDRRGQGIATAILTKLEDWAAEMNYRKCLLETGKNQPEAIALYHKNSYAVIANYGQYENIDNSVCFEKILPISPPR